MAIKTTTAAAIAAAAALYGVAEARGLGTLRGVPGATAAADAGLVFAGNSSSNSDSNSSGNSNSSGGMSNNHNE